MGRHAVERLAQFVAEDLELQAAYKLRFEVVVEVAGHFEASGTLKTTWQVLQIDTVELEPSRRDWNLVWFESTDL
ncbi:MAG: hypothetical protein OXG76_13650 [Acidimicrobiaceae bacterium]|nr:hypothetical protein [Acidimicrobiaceae bacterium]